MIAFKKYFIMEMYKSSYFNLKNNEWVLELLSEDINEMTNQRNIVLAGNILTKEQKKELNLESRLKIGDRFYNMLTEEGKKLSNPKWAFKVLCLNVSSIASRERDLNEFKKYCKKVKMLISIDEYTCDVCKKMDNSLFEISKAPINRLDGCTCEIDGYVYISG